MVHIANTIDKNKDLDCYFIGVLLKKIIILHCKIGFKNTRTWWVKYFKIQNYTKTSEKKKKTVRHLKTKKKKKKNKKKKKKKHITELTCKKKNKKQIKIKKKKN